MRAAPRANPACGTTALGSWLGSNVAWASSEERRDQRPLPPAPIRRTRSGTCDTPDPALRPGRVVPPGFPSPRPLPPPPPQRLPCSAASSVLRGDPSSHTRTSQAYGRSLPWAARPRSTGRASVGSPGSRASRLPACKGSLTARGPPTARAYHAADDVAFRSFGQRRHPETLISRLHRPACRYPCPTLRRRPRGRRRMVGATVVRYSFGVGLFHSFLDAGLSRRSRTAVPNIGAACQHSLRTDRHVVARREESRWRVAVAAPRWAARTGRSRCMSNVRAVWHTRDSGRLPTDTRLLCARRRRRGASRGGAG